MRELGVRYSVMFLVAALIGFVLVSVELALPPSVDCRESLRPSDDCGDPDMPDHAMAGAEGAANLTPVPQGPAETVEGPSRRERDLQSSGHDGSRGIFLAAERRMLLFRLWSSIAPLVFAF